VIPDAGPVTRESPAQAGLIRGVLLLESRFGPEGMRTLDLFLSKAGIETIPVDEEKAVLARLAFRHYGRGRHPAGLNFGDGFS